MSPMRSESGWFRVVRSGRNPPPIVIPNAGERVKVNENQFVVIQAARSLTHCPRTLVWVVTVQSYYRFPLCKKKKRSHGRTVRPRRSVARWVIRWQRARTEGIYPCLGEVTRVNSAFPLTLGCFLLNKSACSRSQPHPYTRPTVISLGRGLVQSFEETGIGDPIRGIRRH